MPDTHLGPTGLAPVRHDNRMHRPDWPGSVGLDEGATPANVSNLQRACDFQRSSEISDDLEPWPTAPICDPTPASLGLLHAWPLSQDTPSCSHRAQSPKTAQPRVHAAMARSMRPVRLVSDVAQLAI